MDRGEGQHWNIAPGNLYSKPQKITIGASSASRLHRPRSGNPAHRSAEGHEVHPPHAHSEPAAHQILGPPDVSQRQHPRPRRLRRASQRAFPARHLRRPLQSRFRRLPHRAARSRISSPTTASASTSPATTASSRKKSTSSTSSGSRRISRASSSRKSITPIRTTTIPTP